MANEILDELNKNVEKSKKSKTEVAYKDNAVLTPEEKQKLALLHRAVKEYEPVFRQLETFFKSAQWNDILKKISKNDDTISYLKRRTYTVSGESIRLVETVKEIIRRYVK